MKNYDLSGEDDMKAYLEHLRLLEKSCYKERESTNHPESVYHPVHSLYLDTVAMLRES